MKNMSKGIILATILIFIISACAPQSISDKVKSKTGMVLYEDDFSDPNSGWQVIEASQGMLGYADGAYRMMLKVPMFTSWVTAKKIYNDVTIDVDVTKTAGPDQSTYGVICRMADEKNFYMFAISSAGYYAIGKVIEGKGPVMLGTDGADKLKASDVITKGDETNHIQATCKGDTLTLKINDQLVSSIQDQDIAVGDFGLMVKTFKEPGLDVKFDNLKVTIP